MQTENNILTDFQIGVQSINIKNIVIADDSNEDNNDFFMSRSNKGYYSFSITKYEKFLKLKGFCRINNDLFRPEGPFLKIISIPETIQESITSIKYWCNSHGYDMDECDSASDTFRKDAHLHRFLEKEFAASPKLKKSTASTKILPFLNHYVEIDANSVTFKSHAPEDGLFMHSPQCKREIFPISDEDYYNSGIYNILRRMTFLGNHADFVIRQEDPNFNRLQVAIGYLIHDFKDEALAKLIFFTDSGDNAISSGGRGKSFIVKLLKQYMNIGSTDMRSINSDNQFIFSDVSSSKNVMVFDELAKNFDLGQFYQKVTGDWQVNQKGKPRYTIPFEESPKILCISNYPPQLDGPSLSRRIFVVPFGNYFQKHKLLEFYPKSGKNAIFSDEWKTAYPNEMAAVDRIITECIQKFLSNPEALNDAFGDFEQNEVSLSQTIGDDVSDFIENYLQSHNLSIAKTGRFSQSDFYANFYSENQHLRDTKSKQALKKDLQIFASSKDCGLNPVPQKLGDGLRYFLISDRKKFIDTYCKNEFLEDELLTLK